MAHDVFISYSSKDKPIADAAAAALESRGIRCWMAPRDIVAGMDWSESIIDAINDARCMLLVYSQNANDSNQIKREVERAVAKGIPVLPLRIQDVPMAKSLEYFISVPHWIDALTPERQRDLNYLAETVQILLDRLAGAPERKVAFEPKVRQPVPQSLPRSRRRFIIIAAIVIVAVAGVAVAFRSRHLDPRLVGRWAARVTAVGIETSHQLSILPSGQYEWVASWSDSGTMAAGGGRIVQQTQSHGVVRQVYSFKGPDVLTITGPIGSAEWRRVRPGTGGSPTLDASLSGAWETSTTDPGGFRWSSTLEIESSGAYSFHSEMRDEGRLETRGSRYTASSKQLSRKREGEMSFVDNDTVLMRDDGSPIGATWKRSP